MTAHLRLATLLVAALALAATAQAAEFTRSPLRSAGLVNAESRWTAVDGRDAATERREIRAHFGAVEDVLERSTPKSLDLAVARFEAALQVELPLAARIELRQRLAARRQLQIARLRDYAAFGEFPLNRHYAGEARPIFVDANGTHCAVGHLMALDGWEARAIEIARATPNVIVGEIDDGPLVSWVLTSGFVQEEAALIQPAYFPPSAGADATPLSTLIVPTATLERNGFRYENFAFAAVGTGGAITPTAADFSLVYGWPPRNTNSTGFFCGDYGPNCVPTQNTLWFGYQWNTASPGLLQTSQDQGLILEFAYDVVALGADPAIRGNATVTSSNYTLGQLFPGSSVLTEVSGAMESASGPGTALLSSPVDRARIRQVLQLGSFSYLASFYSQLVTVPAPAVGWLVGVALAVLGWRGWRPRRSTR